MKRLLSLILAVLLTGTLAVPAAAAEKVISIATREDLEAIGENPTASYRLDANIDLGEKDWTPIPFSGTLDGNGYAIYNLKITETGADAAITVDGNRKEYDTRFAALFSVTRNATIQDLTILGAQVRVETDDHCFAAILAGFLENTRILNCRVEGRVSLYTKNVMVGVGGIAGFGTGAIEKSKADVILTFGDRSDRNSDLRCEQFMGGVLACGNADLMDNDVKIKGFDSCWGYVHNGGLVGMNYRWSQEHPRGAMCGNHVSGVITFFENNPKRRAYCAPYGGELLTHPIKMQGNTHNFKRNELYNQTKELRDHNCKKPEYTEIHVAHKEEEWGYTLHRCSTCGFEYRDAFQAPGHIAGEWEITKEPDYRYEGSRRKTCTVCGDILAQEIIPHRIATEIIILSQKEVKFHYKEQFLLKAHVRPKDAENQNVIWSSSDPSVVAVDQDGTLTALKRGSAIITCQAEDGFATSSCPVQVTYSPLQWIIKCLLFGWLWY